MFTWGPFGERGFSLAVVVVPPGVVEFEVGDEPDGPSISAPITNAGPVEWTFSSTPSGLSSDPASGTLAPGASVTPTLSAAAAGVYAAAIANTTPGGTVNGEDGPGDGGEFTVSAGGPPPGPTMSVEPPLILTLTQGVDGDGPTITAGAGNSGNIDWFSEADPADLTITPSSGSLAPGASVTPTVNSAVTGEFVVTIASTEGVTVTPDEPGNGGVYTVEAAFLEGSVDYMGYAYSFPTPTENFTFAGIYSRADPPAFYGNEPACEFIGYPSSLGCYAGYHLWPGNSSLPIVLTPTVTFAGGNIRALAIVFRLEHRPSENLFTGSLTIGGATDSAQFQLVMNRTAGGVCTIDEPLIGSGPMSCAELQGTHTLRLEFDNPDESDTLVVYMDDVLVGTVSLDTTGDGFGLDALASSSARTFAQATFSTGEGLFTVNSITAQDWTAP